MYYENFEKLLKANNVKAGTVAKATGVSTATLTSWKQGKYSPKEDKLQKLADYFNVPLEYLKTGVMPEIKDIQNGLILSEIALNDNLMSSIEKLLKLKPSDKDLVINLIKTLYEKAEG